MTQLFQFTAAVTVALVFGLTATVLHFVMMARISRAGVQLKQFFLTPRELWNQYRTYYFMASRRNGPLWPLYGYCVAIAGMFGAGIVAMSQLQR